VAAARVAAAAVRLHRLRPSALPAELAAMLVGAAKPLDPVTAAGGGELSFDRARVVPALAEPAVVSLPRQPAGRAWTASERLTLTNPGSQAVDLRIRATTSSRTIRALVPASVRVPPGGTGVTIPLELRSSGSAAGFVTGRLTAESPAGSLSVPFAIPVGDPPPARLGELRLTEEEDGSRGVRFSAGSVSEPDGRLAVDPLGELVLELVREGGGTVRELTPPGGATDLLPGEYAYTLTDETLNELPAGSYRFEARARGPAGGAPVERRSASFEVR
jgi:hypothetical protein